MGLFFQPLRKYADFNGRARRMEYWPFSLVTMFIRVFLQLLALAASSSDPEAASGFSGLSALFTLGLLLPSLGVGVRRLHDTDRSGWWILIGVIPIVGWIAIIVMLAQDGTPNRNRFGPDPKQRGDTLASVFT